MTTGRINQVAFLADAVVERGRRTRRIPRPAATTAVVRFERLTPAFGQTRVDDPLPSRYSASEKSPVFVRRDGNADRPRGTGNTGTPIRGSPGDAPPGGGAPQGELRRLFLPNSVPSVRNTGNPQNGRGSAALVPINEGASKEGSRRSSGDPTNPDSPTATHAPSRSQRPEQASRASATREGHRRRRASPSRAPLGTKSRLKPTDTVTNSHFRSPSRGSARCSDGCRASPSGYAATSPRARAAKPRRPPPEAAQRATALTKQHAAQRRSPNIAFRPHGRKHQRPTGRSGTLSTRSCTTRCGPPRSSVTCNKRAPSATIRPPSR